MKIFNKIFNKIIKMMKIPILIEETKKMLVKIPLEPSDSFFLQNFDSIVDKTYERTERLVELSKGKKVLHFGFLDYPLTKEKLLSGRFLHNKLKKSAEFVFGVDLEENEISEYKKISQDLNAVSLDISQIFEEEKWLGLGQFDLIIFSEVLEHIPNPMSAMQNLYKLSQLYNANVVITVPNAFCCMAYREALLGNERIHPHHYFYFSPYTLKKLVLDAGFKEIDLSFYVSDNLKGPIGLTKAGIIGICK